MSLNFHRKAVMYASLLLPSILWGNRTIFGRQSCSRINGKLKLRKERKANASCLPIMSVQFGPSDGELHFNHYLLMFSFWQGNHPSNLWDALRFQDLAITYAPSINFAPKCIIPRTQTVYDDLRFATIVMAYLTLLLACTTAQLRGA